MRRPGGIAPHGHTATNDGIRGGVSPVREPQAVTSEESSAHGSMAGVATRRRLIDDQSNMNARFMSLASDEGVKTSAPKSAKHSWKNGSSFDEQWLIAVEKGQQTMLRQLQAEANSGTNAKVRQWAGEALPMVRKHLGLIAAARRSIPSAPKPMQANATAARKTL